MSESAELIREAAVKLGHIGSILRAAALESQSFSSASDLWNEAKTVEAQAARVKQMVGRGTPVES
jgi:hypothetical protein